MAILQSTTVSGNLNVTGSLTGTLKAVFLGDVEINGTASIAQLNTINQTSLQIGDKYITILTGALDHNTLDQSGILWGSGVLGGPTQNELGANAHIRYRTDPIDALEIFPKLIVGSGSNFVTITSSSFSGNLSGTAATASVLATPRTISSTGDVIWSVTFDGSGNATAAAAIGTGVIVNADINAAANIADTKLATISTAGKVANSATTATSANTANAIVSRDASGNFSAGIITATLNGTATTALSSSIGASPTGIHNIVLAAGSGNQQLRVDSDVGFDATNNILLLTGSVSASSNITASNLAVNGGDITSTATTLNINASGGAGTIVLQDNTQVTGTLSVSGNISSINGVSYTFPTTQGVSGSVLANNGATPGVLNWSTSVLTASNINVTNDSTTNATRNLMFASTASGPSSVLADTDLTYNPSTNTLTVPNVTSTGTITAGSLVETSSRIFKKEIKTLSNQLEKVVQLNPVSYVRKADEKQELGLIAEEVGEIYPEFVIGQGLNYPKMVSVLIGAIKELNEKVDSQSKELQSLKSKKKRVTKVKKQ